ncbi:MAG: hypothetical protein ACYSUY_07200 [Planctomycetota bacterium]|jgi:hypothetical protein
MKVSKIIKIVLASILIGAGVFWSIMFPKTTAIFRPDFVASVAIGVGLVASGVLVFLVKRSRVLLFMLSLLLLWSLLLNAALLSQAKAVTEIVKDFAQTNTNMGSNK